MKEHFISVLDYQDLSSKSLKHNRDPKRRVGMAAPASEHSLAPLHQPATAARCIQRLAQAPEHRAAQHLPNSGTSLKQA